MNATDSCHLIWLRNDLRIHDQPALFAAAQKQIPLEFVYVLDERLIGPTAWGFNRSGRRRLSWMMANVQELHRQLASFGHTLYVALGHPVDLITKRLAAGGVSQVFLNDEPGFEEQKDADQLRSFAAARGIPCSLFQVAICLTFRRYLICLITKDRVSRPSGRNWNVRALFPMSRFSCLI